MTRFFFTSPPPPENVEQSIQSFLEILRRSGLVEDNRLKQILGEFEMPSAQPFGHTLASLTTLLVRQQALTGWQVAKLREKKYKGFFLDEFVILDYLSSSEDSSRYVARNEKTGKLVVLRVGPPSSSWSLLGPVQYEVEDISGQ